MSKRVEPTRSNQPANTGRIGMDGVLRRGPAAPVDMRVPKQPQPARPQRPQPLPPQPAPAPVRHERPMAPAQSVRQHSQRPQPQQVVRQAQPAQETAPRAPKVRRNRGNGLKIFLQTLLALVVILGVAVAIVVLYLRYYQ